MKILILFTLLCSVSCEKDNTSKVQITFITEEEAEKLEYSPFNPSTDKAEGDNMFSDKFVKEVLKVRKIFTDYFNKFGTYGNLERREKNLESDWWTDQSINSKSRVLFIDLLNPKLQTYEILSGAQKELQNLDPEWLLLVGHDNEYDSVGNLVGKPGKYSFWITKKEIKVYSERQEDIKVFLETNKQ